MFGTLSQKPLSGVKILISENVVIKISHHGLDMLAIIFKIRKYIFSRNLGSVLLSTLG